MADPNWLKSMVFPGESGGDYGAIFGYANRPGGAFAGVDLTKMTVNDVIQFTDPSGPYAQYVKDQLGYVATPTGAYQVVGSTLRDVVKNMGLTGNELYDQATQDAIGQHIYATQGAGAWEGWGRGGGGGPAVVASTKGGAPVNGLLGVPPEQEASGLIGLLTGKQKPWAGKLNDIGAVLLALSGSPAAQPLMEQLNKRKDAKREDARLNQTAAWLSSVGRDDLASAVMAGGLSGSDAAAIAMTPAETPEAVKLQTFTGPDGKVYSFNPVTGEKVELTGAEMPEPGYQFMTPEEIAATPGLDPNKAYQKGPDRKISEIGGGGVTVNTGDGGDAKFDEAFAKGDAETLKTISDAGIQATRNMGRIDQLSALLDANPTGAGAALQQFAGELGIATEGLDEIQAAQAIINSLVPEQRQPGSGPMSDADLALFKQSLPQIMTQPGGNKIIVDTMRAIAQYDAQGAQIVQAVRDGTMTRAQAFDALQNRVNPLAEFAGSTAPASGDLAVGTVEDGYKYLGGDPSLPTSWEAVQ
jgi:hypothetical protein